MADETTVTRRLRVQQRARAHPPARLTQSLRPISDSSTFNDGAVAPLSGGGDAAMEKITSMLQTMSASMIQQIGLGD